jgi:thiol:disulfide interchange protein DsbC
MRNISTKFLALCFLSLSTAGAAQAEETLQAEATEDPRKAIAEMVPGLTVENVRPSPVAGLYEVDIGAQIVYVSADTRYLFKGDIIDLSNNESLTDRRRNSLRMSQLDGVSESEMVVFDSDNAEHTITVFTDVDCTFCRKLHKEVPQLQELGIRVRYLSFPRHGPGSDSWKQAEAVWCSEDRQSALTRAKKGEKIEAEDCGPTPVAAQYELGSKLGVRGTPAIILESGELISGYLPANDLADYLNRE